MDGPDIEDLRHALVQSWNVVPGDAPQEDDLLESLARRVGFLMRHDLQRLMTGLYLLDISETRFAQASLAESRDDRAWEVARLILEREIEKMESRKYYKRRGSVDVQASPTQGPQGMLPGMEPGYRDSEPN